MLRNTKRFIPLQPAIEVEKREVKRLKNFKIKFGNKKKVSTFAVPKERDAERQKVGSDFQQTKLKKVNLEREDRNTIRAERVREKVLLRNRKSCNVVESFGA